MELETEWEQPWENDWDEPWEFEDPTDSDVPETVLTPETEETEFVPETQASIPAVIYEDFSGAPTEGTETIVIIETIETVGSDLAHATLFSGFLICGTLIGLFIMRKIYGT